MLTIKGAFADCIGRILHHNNETTPKSMLTTEVSVDNDDSKVRIVELFMTCISFDIKDDYIEFTVKRNQEEIDKFHEERKYSLSCEIKQLRKWCDNKVEDKEQILTYLKAKKLDWIIESIA